MEVKNVRLIYLPENPLWKVFKTLGRNELIALVFSVAATFWLTNFLTTSSGLVFVSFLSSFGIPAVVTLVLIGPIAEELALFFYYQYLGWEDYTTTPSEERKSCRFFIKKYFLIWSSSLARGIFNEQSIIFRPRLCSVAHFSVFRGGRGAQCHLWSIV